MIMRLLRFLFRPFLSLFKFCEKHPKGTLAAGGLLGGGAAAFGLNEGRKAKKMNKQAMAIQHDALAKHDAEYSETVQVLSQLGTLEKQIADSFEDFADVMEKIQGRPEFKTSLFSTVKLPNYQPKELRKFSEDFQLAIAGAGGAGMGALGGLAAFGGAAIVAAPAMLAGGIVLCVKGFSLKKKAVENVNQAKQMRESVKKIVSFYADVRSTANSIQSTVENAFQKYTDYLAIISKLTSQKQTWSEFSRSERKKVENTVLLARILYQFCKTPIITKSGSQSEIESVNHDEILNLQKQADKLLDGMK